MVREVLAFAALLYPALLYPALLYHCKVAGSAASGTGWFMQPRENEKENASIGEFRKQPHAGIFFAGVLALLALGMLALAMLSACDVERRKSDAELGLNVQQSAGRKIYDSACDRCHEPYSSRGKKGPPLKGVFQHKYLSLSGLPANDERVTDIIRLGRNEMPGFSQTLSGQNIQDLLAYLHTL
jgi:mono/diheme cytochrome c family protein